MMYALVFEGCYLKNNILCKQGNSNINYLSIYELSFLSEIFSVYCFLNVPDNVFRLTDTSHDRLIGSTLHQKFYPITEPI
jgi:hypothetical protein